MAELYLCAMQFLANVPSLKSLKFRRILQEANHFPSLKRRQIEFRQNVSMQFLGVAAVATSSTLRQIANLS
jgi:hypothetical protein